MISIKTVECIKKSYKHYIRKVNQNDNKQLEEISESKMLISIRKGKCTIGKNKHCTI